MLQLFFFLKNLLRINILHLVTGPYPIWTSFQRFVHASNPTSHRHRVPVSIAYRRRHSTETSILHTLDSDSDSGRSIIVISLDLSAAFDTIDHQILLSRLNNSFGISDTTLSWLQSYLTNRTSSVRILDVTAPHPSQCTTGVPQGSVLGPLLFTAYVSPNPRHRPLSQYRSTAIRR